MSQAVLTIDGGAVVANWRSLAARHPGQTAAVVKADAYGLGATFIAPALAEAGCRHFFVATVDEAIGLRALLPGRWIAVLNGCPAGAEADMIAQDLQPVLNSLADCERWQAAARAIDRPLPALLHVDTGMSRLGLDAGELTRLQHDKALLDGIALSHVMTHLVCAETPDAPENACQAAAFTRIAAIFPGVRTSVANSSGLFLGPAFQSDLARPGYALYGGNPTPQTTNPMRPTITLAAPIRQIRAIESGETVGYGASWRATRPSRIATIAVGYADGIPRGLGAGTTARLGGQRVPLVGRVSMDLMTFDVTDYPDAVPGALLELIGPDQGIDDLAAKAGTIGYEILTRLGRRYRRVAKSV